VTLAARAVFVLLVGATFAAFFVAQRLKSAPRVVQVGHLVKNFSPDGDGRRDLSTMRVRVKERDDVTVTIIDAKGNPVRRIAVSRPMAPGRPVRLAWDGTTDAGDRAPEGIYHVRVSLRRQGRAITVPRTSGSTSRRHARPSRGWTRSPTCAGTSGSRARSPGRCR